MYRDNAVYDVREHFVHLLMSEEFVTDKTGSRMLEIQGASFLATEDRIFGEPNLDYIKREIAWYESCSLNVNDIPEGPPVIWKQVATAAGKVNSNYGHLIWSTENGRQYENVLRELIHHEQSRRAIMIYNRPSIHMEYNSDGMSDFICTTSVQYLVRSGFLDAIVNMRSNDVRFGYLNDRSWQFHVQKMLSEDISRSFGRLVIPGHIYWNAGSLHVYEKDFFLVDHYYKTGEVNISKPGYRALYPNSPWSN